MDLNVDSNSGEASGKPDETAAVGIDSASVPSGNSKESRSSGSIQVNPCQRGNPLLKEIRNIPWEFVDGILPDYILGHHCSALYLSVRYHNLNPNYIHDRLKKMGSSSGNRLRVLLVLVDVKDPHHSLNQLTRISILCELTLMLAWNTMEAGKILETYKMFENKPPDMIMEKAASTPHEKVAEALTSIKSVSKTDAATLLGTFKTMEKIVGASQEDLALCPGFGPQKAQRLYKVLHENFRRVTN